MTFINESAYIYIYNPPYKAFVHRLKVILCASEHICTIVRYFFRSFKQL